MGAFGAGEIYPWAEISFSEISDFSYGDLQSLYKRCDEKLNELAKREVKDVDAILSAVCDRALCMHVIMLRAFEKYQNVDEEFARIRKECEDQEELCRNLGREKEEYQVKIEKCESQLRDLVEENRELSESVDRYRKLLQKSDEADSMKQSRISELMSEVHNLRKEKGDLDRQVTMEISRKKVEVRYLEEEICKVRERFNAVQEDNLRLKERLNELEKESPKVVGSDEVSQVKWFDLVKRTEETLQELKQTIKPLRKSEKKEVEYSGQEWMKFCKNITPYNPDVSKSGMETFLASLSSKMKTRSPPFSNEEKISILRFTLEGPAQISREGYPKEIQEDFEKLCARLQRDFGRFPCEEAALAALRGKEGKQGAQERPGEFVRRLERLCAQAYGKAFSGKSDVQLRIAFVEGLLPQVRDRVEGLALKDIDDMLEKAEVFYHKLKPLKSPDPVHIFNVTEGPQSQLKLEHGPNGSDEGGSNVSQTKESKGSNKGGPSNGSKGNGNFKGACYKCGLHGHRIRECPQKQDRDARQDDFKTFMDSMKAFFEQHTRIGPGSAAAGVVDSQQ